MIPKYFICITPINDVTEWGLKAGVNYYIQGGKFGIFYTTSWKDRASFEYSFEAMELVRKYLKMDGIYNYVVPSLYLDYTGGSRNIG